MDHPPTTPRIATQQRTRDAALRRLRHLTIGAAVLGTAGTAALGGLAAVTYAGHVTATPAAVAEVGSGAASATTAAPTAAPTATSQLGSSPVVVGRGSAGSGMVTSGGS